MLEIEDLMLEGSSVVPMSTREVIQVLSAGTHHLVERLREMGSSTQGVRMPAEASIRDTDALGGPVRNRAQTVDEPASASLLPRVSLGPADDVASTANASTARDEGRDARDIEPHLQSSDYLYDYVVLGLLDIVASIRVPV
jgi:hypothetical protein